MINRDPLRALGLSGPLSSEQAAVIMQFEHPALAQELRDDEAAQELAARVAAEEAWDEALPGGRGYQGPRGTAEA